MKHSILVVEDEKIVRVTLAEALKEEGYIVLSVADGEAAESALDEADFSLVITDIRLPGIGGMALLNKCLNETPSTAVIMMTAFGTIKDAVDAMRIGAFDYVTKPFDLDEMLLTVGKALELRSITEENIRLKKELTHHFGAPNIIGESKAMQAVFALLDKIGRTDSTILILGESGTGKELVASTIHYQSSRKDKPIIRVNCSALPDELIESELFGYEKGAFTGATSQKPGRFDLADGGTIVLDEICDLPLLTQTKIMRVLEERTFERLGATLSTHVNVRIIAATNKDLEEEVRKGNFREDLYYRLNVIPITLPPLRRRKEDIPLLINAFTKKIYDQIGCNASFSSSAIRVLMEYSFPGNVRELINLVERSVVLADTSNIEVTDLPPHIAGLKKSKKTAIMSLQEVTAETEKKYLKKILKLTNGNRSRASEILGISRKTLWEKLNLHQLDL